MLRSLASNCYGDIILCVGLPSIWDCGVGGAAVLAACAFFLKFFSEVSPGKELDLNNAEKRSSNVKSTLNLKPAVNLYMSSFYFHKLLVLG